MDNEEGPHRAELMVRTTRGIARDHEICETLRTLLKWGFLAVIAYFAFRSIGALAGQTTEANIFIKFLADIRVSRALAMALGGSGVVFGIRQARLRRISNKRLGEKNRELEKQIDDRRTSSQL